MAKKDVLKRSLAVLSVCLTVLATNGRAAAPPARQESAPAAARPELRALDTYCITCHNQRARIGGLSLDTLDPDHIGDRAEIWEKVLRKLRTGTMPPDGARRPEPAVYDALTAWLTTELDRAGAATPNAGRPRLHRVNRAEYANAIRDLFDLTVDTATLLPADDSAYGFDNVADALGVSPSLQERYLSAAATISA